MKKHVHRSVSYTLLAASALVLLSVPACDDKKKSGGTGAIVANAMNHLVDRFRECNLVTSGTIQKVDASEYEGTPKPFAEYFACIYKCLAAASCEDLQTHLCTEDESLTNRCDAQCPFDYTCGDGEVVSLDLVCDGEQDCDDNSDETNCPEEEMFTCGSGEEIPEDYVCDTEEDCEDGSDEAGCPPADMFTCGSGEQVPQRQVCDLESDCEDGSDEDQGCAQWNCEQ